MFIFRKQTEAWNWNVWFEFAPMYLSTDSSMIHKAFQLLQVSRWWILHLKALLKMEERNIQTSNYVWLQHCSDGEGRAELSRGLTGTGWLHSLSYANGWNDSTAMQRLRSHTHTHFSLFTAFGLNQKADTFWNVPNCLLEKLYDSDGFLYRSRINTQVVMDSLVVAMVVYNIDELPCVSVYVSLCWFLKFGIQPSYKKFNSIN